MTKNTLMEADVQVQQAVALVDALCGEMTEVQIAKAMGRWDSICERQGWRNPRSGKSSGSAES
jgi:hypothetical protein